MERPYRTPDSAACEKEGALAALPCGKYADLMEGLSRRTLEIVETDLPLPLDQHAEIVDPNVMHTIEALQSQTRLLMHPDKLGPSLHPEKVSAELGAMFERALEKDGVEWLLVNRQFGDLYMATLASLIADKEDLATVTGDRIEHGRTMLTMFGKSTEERQPERGVLISLTMQKLNIDPTVPISQLLKW
jgi:hypothetical protein